MMRVLPLLFALLTLAASPAMAADILVESRDGGQNHNHYTEPRGGFLDSNTPAETAKSAAPGVTLGIGSRKATVPSEPSGSSDVIAAARFTPPIETEGNYHVYITFPRAANANPVDILVKSADGEETRKVHQDGWGARGVSNANRWVPVGQFRFTPEGQQYVELRITGETQPADTRNQGQMFADAVRFSTEPITATAATPARPAQSQAQSPGQPAVPTLPANTPVQLIWADSLTEARTLASEARKNVFVYFYSPASARSSDYDNQVLTTPAVQAAIQQGFVPVRINMDQNAELAVQLQVFRAGTIGLYNAQAGNELLKITDTPPAPELTRRLNSIR